jgi:transcriptional regulator with XRE-family HTH domain
MSTIDDDRLAVMLRQARAAHALSLQEVGTRAACSAGYVHKLEMNRVRTPSPRVLAALAEALGLSYEELMSSAGYHPLEHSGPPTGAGAVKRFSNAHIVELLEAMQADITELKNLLQASR